MKINPLLAMIAGFTATLLLVRPGISQPFDGEMQKMADIKHPEAVDAISTCCLTLTSQLSKKYDIQMTITHVVIKPCKSP